MLLLTLGDNIVVGDNLGERLEVVVVKTGVDGDRLPVRVLKWPRACSVIDHGHL